MISTELVPNLANLIRRPRAVHDKGNTYSVPYTGARPGSATGLT